MDHARALIPHQPLYKHVEREAEEQRGPEGEDGGRRGEAGRRGMVGNLPASQREHI